MEIAPNIHWIDLGMINVFLLVEADGLTLIDTGMPNKPEQIWAYVEKIGRQPTDIKHLLVTHADIDHAGNLAAIHEQTQAEVYASRQAATLIDKGLWPKHNSFLIDTIGFFRRYPALPATQITVIKDGQELPILGGLQVLGTPGHTMDHLSFYHPTTQTALVGDLLVTRGEKLQLPPAFITADTELTKHSAKLLLAHEPRLLACGHGPPLPSDHPSVIDLKQQL